MYHIMYEYDFDIVTAFSVAVKHYEGLHSCFHVNCCFRPKRNIEFRRNTYMRYGKRNDVQEEMVGWDRAGLLCSKQARRMLDGALP